MKLNDAVWGVLLLALATALLVHVQTFPTIPGQDYGPALFPGVIAVGLAVCGALLVMKGLAVRDAPRAAWVALDPWTRRRPQLIGFGAVLAVNVMYVAYGEKLGFVVAGSVYLAVLFTVFRVRPRWVLPLAIGLTLIIHYAFYKLLRVPLPWGLLQPFAW